MNFSSEKSFFMKENALCTLDAECVVVVDFFNDALDFNRNFLHNFREILSNDGNFSREYMECQRYDSGTHTNELPFPGLQTCYGWPEDIAYLSDRSFYQIMKLLGGKYMQLHPETTDEINSLFSHIE